MPISKEKRIAMIIEFATKVVNYPKGSKGYDPIDEINLKNNLDKFHKEYPNG